jgi:hypothetical protein
MHAHGTRHLDLNFKRHHVTCQITQPRRLARHAQRQRPYKATTCRHTPTSSAMRAHSPGNLISCFHLKSSLGQRTTCTPCRLHNSSPHPQHAACHWQRRMESKTTTKSMSCADADASRETPKIAATCFHAPTSTKHHCDAHGMRDLT